MGSFLPEFDCYSVLIRALPPYTGSNIIKKIAMNKIKEINVA